MVEAPGGPTYRNLARRTESSDGAHATHTG